MIISLLILLVALVISGLFSGSESALFSLDKGKISRLTEKQPSKSKILRLLLSKPEKTLSVILLGNLSVNVVFSYFGNQLLRENFTLDKHSELVYLMVITFILLIFGEIIPKVTALRRSEKWSMSVSRIIYFWYRISVILAWPIYLLTNLITKRIPDYKSRIQERDLVNSVEDAQSEGILNANEQFLLKRAVNFYYDTAYNIMIPRSQVFMLAHTCTVAKAQKEFAETGAMLSFIYNEKDGSIMGYLHVRNLVPKLKKKQNKILKYISEPLSFPATISLRDLLGEFIKSKIEVAVILDELGEFAGIVTMKEIFQKLMGELNTSVKTKPTKHRTISIKKLNDRNYRVMGGTTLDDFNEFFHKSFSGQSSETLSGYLIEKLDGYPQANTKLLIDGLIFSQMKIKKYIITSVKVTENQIEEETEN
ncbi:MAG: hemolysin family protein [Leptospirales bacterium]